MRATGKFAGQKASRILDETSLSSFDTKLEEGSITLSCVGSLLAATEISRQKSSFHPHKFIYHVIGEI